MTLWSISTKQSSRFRDRFSVAGAKDDRRDAQVTASVLGTDQHAYREVPALTKEQRIMRRLVHCRGRLIRQKVKLSNQLKELLCNCFPALSAAAEDVVQSWFLSFLEQAPIPHQAQKMTSSELQNLLKKHRIRRLDADVLQQILRQQVFAGVDPMVSPETIEFTVLVPQLQLVLLQIKDIERQIDAAFEPRCQPAQQAQYAETDSGLNSDLEILRSMLGVGKNVSSVLCSEASVVLERRDYQALRTLSGVAPVTQHSGKKTIVRQRRAVNNLMKNALYHWARVACQHDALCKQKFDRLEARGKTHGQALRCVGERLFKVLCTILQNNNLYEPKPPETVPTA